MSDAFPTVVYHPDRYDAPVTLQRAAAFSAMMDRRRSVRQFSDRPVPPELMQELVRTAGTVPSGAHKQPWTFCLESGA